MDSSVLLRVVLGESGRLRVWSRITSPVASELIGLECLRTMNRARIRLGLEDRDTADRRAAVLEAIETFSQVPIGRQAVSLRLQLSDRTVVGNLRRVQAVFERGKNGLHRARSTIREGHVWRVSASLPTVPPGVSNAT